MATHIRTDKQIELEKLKKTFDIVISKYEVAQGVESTVVWARTLKRVLKSAEKLNKKDLKDLNLAISICSSKGV